MDTYDQLYQFDTVGESPSCVVYHPVNYVVACGFRSGAVRIFGILISLLLMRLDISATYVLEEYTPHKYEVVDLIYCNNALISASKDCLCIADSLRNYQPIKMMHYMSPNEHVSIALSPDGKLLAAVGPSGSVCNIYDTNMYEKAYTLETGSDDVFMKVCFSSDSKELIAITSDMRLLKYCIQSGKLVAEVVSGDYSGFISVQGNIHKALCRSLEISPNGKYLITGADDKIMKIWDYGFSENAELCQSFIGHSAPILKAIFSPDSKLVLSVGDVICVWEFLGDTSRDLNLLIDNLIAQKSKSPQKQIIEEDSPLPRHFDSVLKEIEVRREKEKKEERKSEILEISKEPLKEPELESLDDKLSQEEEEYRDDSLLHTPKQRNLQTEISAKTGSPLPFKHFSPVHVASPQSENR